MSRKWNGKALTDELMTRLWDTSSANKERVITWINEIQDDLVSEIPLDHFKFRLKKLLPTGQEIIELSPQIPTVSTVVIASGGSLTENSLYKVGVTNIVWDDDQKDYIESEMSLASSAVTATASNKTINVSNIPEYDGDTSHAPSIIWRRLYVQVSTDSGATYSEPFYHSDIEDNTTTTASITTETTSTITPPSDSEVDQLHSNNPFSLGSGKYLVLQDMASIRRYNPTYSDSGTPSYFDFVGSHKINLYPRLSATATTAQRTLTYFVHRRPHEVFYDVDRKIDLPITFKKALIEGVLWKGYEFRDRDGHVTKLNNYEKFKMDAKNKLRRTKLRPSVVRDVTGDTHGYEV